MSDPTYSELVLKIVKLEAQLERVREALHGIMPEPPRPPMTWEMLYPPREARALRVAHAALAADAGEVMTPTTEGFPHIERVKSEMMCTKCACRLIDCHCATNQAITKWQMLALDLYRENMCDRIEGDWEGLMIEAKAAFIEAGLLREGT